MALAVLGDGLIFDVILTMYFSYGKEKSRIGQAVLILNIMFHMLKQT